MRKHHQPLGMQDTGGFCQLRAGQNIYPNAEKSSSKSNQTFEFENTIAESHLLRRAMAVVDGVFPANPDFDADSVFEDLAINQLSLEEELEEELASNFHQATPSLYMPTLHDDGNLEKVTETVSSECDNLIAACDSPDQINCDGLDDARQNSIPLKSLGNGANRIEGMRATPKDSATGLLPTRMFVAVIAILLAMLGGVYAYNNPQNPLQLAMQSKIAQLVDQYRYQKRSNFSKNANASFIELASTSKNIPVPSEKSASLPQLPIVAAVRDIGGLDSDSNNDTGPAIVRIINIAEEENAKIRVANPSQTLANEDAVLSERFDGDAVLSASQPVVRVLPDSTIPQIRKNVPDTHPQMTAVLKREPIAMPRKLDMKTVERDVLSANFGDALDDVQFKALVARLVEGDCVSSALRSIFGENKISPVFVRDLLKNSENRC